MPIFLRVVFVDLSVI